jgi:hypothetical protein
VCCVAQHSTNGLDLVVVYSVVLVYGHRVRARPSVVRSIESSVGTQHFWREPELL